MNFPGEELISTAIDKFSDGVIKKMDNAEEKRNREFALKIKELEYYKSNYDKEIKSVFDRWFDLLQNTLISTNKATPEETKKQYKKKVDNFLKIENVTKLKIDTMKYGGKKTGEALAVFSQISYNSSDDDKYAGVYSICELLSVLKTEILGQNLEPETIIKILITDYDENKRLIKESKDIIEKKHKELFN